MMSADHSKTTFKTNARLRSDVRRYTLHDLKTIHNSQDFYTSKPFPRLFYKFLLRFIDVRKTRKFRQEVNKQNRNFIFQHPIAVI
jgi:hypothetical protein